MVTHLFRTHTRFPQTSWSAIRCVCVFCCFVSAGCAGSHHSRHWKVEMVSACLVWQRSCQRIHCRCVISYRHRLLNFDLINPLSDPPSLRILEPCWWCSPGIILSSEWEWQTSQSRLLQQHTLRPSEANMAIHCRRGSSWYNEWRVAFVCCFYLLATLHPSRPSQFSPSLSLQLSRPWCNVHSMLQNNGQTTQASSTTLRYPKHPEAVFHFVRHANIFPQVRLMWGLGPAILSTQREGHRCTWFASKVPPNHNPLSSEATV